MPHLIDCNKAIIIWFLFLGDMYVYRYFLVSPSDFYYEYQQKCAMYYVNTIPHFSAIPWFYIKRQIKAYSVRHGVKLLMYSGTLKQLELLHSNGTYVPIYLDDRLKRVPYPELIWKVIYDQKNSAGIALIGVNNYFLRGRYTPMCNDISSQFRWMLESIREYVYACTIEDWFAVVNNSFPNFPAKHLLGRDFNSSVKKQGEIS